MGKCGKKHIIVISFVVLFLRSAVAGSSFQNDDKDSLINEFFSELYDFSFRKADSLANALSLTDIDKSTMCNLKANLAWYRLLSGESPQENLEACKKNLDQVIGNKQIDSVGGIIPVFNTVYAWSLRSRIENYRGNTLESMMNFYKAVSLMKNCPGDPATDEKLCLITGLHLYLTGYFEEEYPMLGGILFPSTEGNRTQGMQYLEKCSVSEDEMIRTESDYFLLKIRMYLEKDYRKAYSVAERLISEHPENVFYSLEKLKLLQKINLKEAGPFGQTLISGISRSENLSAEQKNHLIAQVLKISGQDSR